MVEGLRAEGNGPAPYDEENQKTNSPSVIGARHLSLDHDLVLKTFRLLISDLCQQFNGGHPG